MTADEGTANTLPDVPPDWVALSDLPATIARWYGVSMTVVAPDVVDAVWTGELYPWHRIAGIKPPYGRLRGWPDGLADTGVRPIYDPNPEGTSVGLSLTIGPPPTWIGGKALWGAGRRSLG